MLTEIPSQNYQTILNEINTWSAVYKIRLLQDVLDSLKPLPDKAEVLAELRLSVMGKDYLPPRQVSVAEATGIIQLADTALSLEVEIKKVL